MMSKKSTIFFIFFMAFNCYAQLLADVKKMQSEPYTFISGSYLIGKNLIYDCEKKSFICVDDQSFKDCATRRLNRFNKNALNLSCAPLVSHLEVDSCLKHQLAMIHQPRDKTIKDICLGEHWQSGKKKRVKF